MSELLKALESNGELMHRMFIPPTTRELPPLPTVWVRGFAACMGLFFSYSTSAGMLTSARADPPNGNDPLNRPGDKIIARIIPSGENPFLAIKTFRVIDTVHDPQMAQRGSHLIIRVTGIYDSFVCGTGSTPTLEYHFLPETEAGREVILPRIRQTQIETRSLLTGAQSCRVLQEPREFEVDLRFEPSEESQIQKKRWELRFTDGSGSKLATLQVAYSKERGWNHSTY